MASIPPTQSETYEQKMDRLNAEATRLSLLIAAEGDPVRAAALEAALTALIEVLVSMGIPVTV